MPVFHKYSEGYHKSGYYVNVNWSAPHPYPLQTPSITAQIYLEFGYEPGDSVPNELTSRLFHAGLHWTGGQGPGQPSDPEDPDSVVKSDIPSLTTEQIEKLESLLDRSIQSADFEDVDRESIATLKSQLQELENTSTSEREIIFQASNSVKQIEITIPDPIPTKLSERQAKNVLLTWDAIDHAESIDSELFREFALAYPRDNEALIKDAYKRLLADTPFNPKTFPEIADGLPSHHRLTEYDFSIDPIALAYCTAAFYDGFTTSIAIEEADGQGDTTVLYQRNGRTLLVGNELLMFPVSSGGGAVPPSAFQAAVDHPRATQSEFSIRIWSALSEQQFHRGTNIRDSHVRRVIGAGLEQTNLNVILLGE